MPVKIFHPPPTTKEGEPCGGGCGGTLGFEESFGIVRLACSSVPGAHWRLADDEEIETWQKRQSDPSSSEQ